MATGDGYTIFGSCTGMCDLHFIQYGIDMNPGRRQKNNKKFTEVVIAEPWYCDFCAKKGIQTVAAVDGKTIFGPWAGMCDLHFIQYGIGLGLGLGQKLILKEKKNRKKKTGKQAEMYMNLADHFFDDGNYDSAINALTKVIELHPNNAKAFDRRGVAHGCRDEYDDAIIDFNRAIEIDADLGGAYNNRALSYYKKYMFDEAIVDYNKAIELDPYIAIFHYNRGLAYYNKCEYAVAISDYNEAIKLDPSMADAYSSRGEAYASLGRYKKALADFNKAVALEPGHIDAYASRILMINLQQMGDWVVPFEEEGSVAA